MFSWLKRRITCPYCLGNTPLDSNSIACTFCKQQLPLQYIQSYDEQPPIFIQTLGWSGVGKTVFLQAMTYMLMQMGRAWSDYSYAALNDISQQQLNRIVKHLGRGEMPIPTQGDEQEVCLLALRNMVRWGGRTLVTRDCPGEIFDTMAIPLRQAPYLLSASTAFMLITAPGEGLDDDARTCDQLLNNYINSLTARGINLRRDPRTVVVVITKADEVTTLPKELRRYLIADPLWAAISRKSARPHLDERDMDQYVSYMQFASDQIRAWLQTDVTGRNMLRLAERHGIDLCFALISSTGEAATNGVLSIEHLAPRRVLDPYFWALELQDS